jgi:hypothetical protein
MTRYGGIRASFGVKFNPKTASKITKRIQNLSKKATEEYAKEVFLHKLKRQSVSESDDNYGVIAEKNSNGSITQWKVSTGDSGDNFRVGFYNNAQPKQGDYFDYVKTLYSSKPHKHYHDGYASRNTHNLTEQKVERMKQEFQDGVANEIKNIFKYARNK